MTAVGLAEAPDGEAAILATEYLAYSIQYRRLLMRFPLGPGPYRDRLLDAMASLLVDLHRAGVYWGDCSLANTLFRRDGDKIQAYLVDAETSEIHPSLSDGQRALDLDILVENVGFGLADLGAMQGRDDAFEDAIAASETVRSQYLELWDELHLVPELPSDDRHAIRARIRRLNDLGFAVDEISLEPSGAERGRVRLRVAVASRRFHARELQQLTGLVALEGQARLLLNDVREYQAWLERRAVSHPDRGGRRSVAPRRPRTQPGDPGPGHRAEAGPGAGVLRRPRAEVAALGGGPGRRRAGGRARRLPRPSGRRRRRTRPPTARSPSISTGPPASTPRDD